MSKLEEIDNETFAALSLDDIAKFYVDDYNEESVDKNINTNENEIDLKESDKNIEDVEETVKSKQKIVKKSAPKRSTRKKSQK